MKTNSKYAVCLALIIDPMFIARNVLPLCAVLLQRLE